MWRCWAGAASLLCTGSGPGTGPDEADACGVPLWPGRGAVTQEPGTAAAGRTGAARGYPRAAGRELAHAHRPVTAWASSHPARESAAARRWLDASRPGTRPRRPIDNGAGFAAGGTVP